MGWKTAGQNLVYSILNPVIKGLVKLGVTPNMITSIGLLINVAATVIFILGAELGERNDHSYIGWAGATLLFGGLFDMIDGRLARVGKMTSDYGALYDSVLDRYSELFMFFGICYYLVSHNYFWSSIFAFIAMIGSVMVSYTRARAEGLGVSASVGIMQRPERILLIATSALLCGVLSNVIGQDTKFEVDWLPVPLFETITIFTFPIFILAIWANLTALQRLMYSKKKMKPQN
jgi:phosphatidylglycerophosphate synthase